MSRRKWYLLGVMLVLVIGAVVYLAGHGAEGIASLRRPVDLYAEGTDYKEIKPHDLIYAEYYISLGCFAEVENTTTGQTGKVTDKNSVYYYAVPVFEGEVTRWIGLAVAGEADAGTLDVITDETYTFLSHEAEDYGYTTISKYGTLKKMDDEMYGYMQNAFRDLGVYDGEEMTQYVLPLYVAAYDPGNARKMFVGVMLALVISLVFLGMWLRNFIAQRREAQTDQNTIHQDE